MLIPKTLKTREIIRNHITKEIFQAIAFLSVALLMLTMYVVHPFFKIPFALVCALVVWLVVYPSEWNKDITRAELFFKYVLADRRNNEELTEEAIEYAIRFYENQQKETELEKARQKYAKRTF